MVPSEFPENFQKQWNEMLNSNEGNKRKRLLAIDGKTQRGNGTKNQKANYIVSAVDGKGFCVGQKRVGEKTNEIKAIPQLLDCLNIKGTIITTDATGRHTDDILWLSQKKEWAGRKTVILTRNTVTGEEGEVRGRVCRGKVFYKQPADRD